MFVLLIMCRETLVCGLFGGLAVGKSSLIKVRKKQAEGGHVHVVVVLGGVHKQRCVHEHNSCKVFASFWAIRRRCAVGMLFPL